MDLGRTLRAYRRKVYDRHRAHWMVRDLAAQPVRSEARPDLRLLVDAPDRVHAFLEQLRVPGTLDPVERRTMRERGHLLVGLLAGDTLIGFSKLGWNRVYVLDYRLDLELPPGWFYVLDTAVVPEWRRRGAGTFLVEETCAEMRSRGFTHRLSQVRADNAAMLATARRAGYALLGTVDYVSILGRRRWRPEVRTLIPTPDAVPQMQV
jgi:ribosomal protein S18 acetylase RimI-like enzyme